MSSLYKRGDSVFYWWTSRYKGKRLRKSTKMTQKQHARKIQTQWDMDLMLGDLSFLGKSTLSAMIISDFIRDYFIFVEKRKDAGWFANTKGAVLRFLKFTEDQGINRMDEISVKLLNNYIESMTNAPKTIKNHIQIISLMLNQAVTEDVISSNPAKKVSLPQIIKVVKYRRFEPIDMEIIMNGAGKWRLYYQFLYNSGLRCGDVAMLTYGNIDRAKKRIVHFVRKSRRVHEFPIADVLLNVLPNDRPKDEPIFPELYSNSEAKLNHLISKPRKHLQSLLEIHERPKGHLHCFRTTFNNALRDLGLRIEDRQILLAHASSAMTKVYTHPNFDLALEYVNRLPQLHDNDEKN